MGLQYLAIFLNRVDLLFIQSSKNHSNLCCYHSISLSSFIIHSWYFGDIKRPEAEKLLKTPPNEHGAFLVRDSDKGGYALSMKDGDMVKHYKIRSTETGNFFIAHNNPFTTLSDLIQYYTKTADGLCDILKKACVKVRFFYDKLDSLHV